MAVREGVHPGWEPFRGDVDPSSATTCRILHYAPPPTVYYPNRETTGCVPAPPGRTGGFECRGSAAATMTGQGHTDDNADSLQPMGWLPGRSEPRPDQYRPAECRSAHRRPARAARPR